LIKLPDHIARCPGIPLDEEGTEWHDDCENCLRRLAAPSKFKMQPPRIIAFFCEFVIEV
jgi:hypothetical protein